MRSKLFLFFLLIASNSYCQYFEKVFLVDSTNPLEICHKSVQWNNGDIIAAGTNDGCGACGTINYVTRIDSLGDTLWLKKFYPGTSPLPIDFVKDDSDIVFITGVDDFDSLGNTMITVMLYRLSFTDGAIINSNQFNLYYNQITSVSINLFIQDSTFALFTGFHKVRLDHNLDTMYVRNYYGGMTETASINNNRFAAVVKFNYQSVDSAAFEIFDSNLDSILLIPVSQSLYRFFQWPTWNSMHIAFGENKYYFSAYNAPDDSIVFGCMDTSSNELWSKVSLPNTQITISDLLGDSSHLYAVGENNHTAGPSGDGYLLGLNAVGDTSLYMTYKAFGYYAWNRLYHVERTFNNGFLLSGITSNPISVPRSSYILKTDSTGNTPITLNINHDKNDAVRNFINPTLSDGYFQVNFEKELKLEIYNSIGGIVYSDFSQGRNTINLTSKRPGIYFAVIYCSNNIYMQKIIIQK